MLIVDAHLCIEQKMPRRRRRRGLIVVNGVTALFILNDRGLP
ncbi:hypothetical protein [Streptomyces sp. I4(2020)]|nr:hypothetical protein [Streptomyces sp. I4(2020)]